MRASFPEILDEARSTRSAIGAFTAYNGATAIGVVRAAEERDVPAMLLVSEASLRSPNGRLLLPLLLAVSARAEVPTCVQLDHVTDERLMLAALEAGVGAVMADGSKLDFAENVALARRAVKAACRHSAHIEAELGHIEGGEDLAVATNPGSFTDPAEAATFVEATGVACLAVSIGNVHGTYASVPNIDFDRLGQIRRRVETPLSLHGASGLPDEDIRRSVELGICKINVNTEIRTRLFTELERRLAETSKGANLLALEGALIDAVREVAGAKLDLLRGPIRKESP